MRVQRPLVALSAVALLGAPAVFAPSLTKLVTNLPGPTCGAGPFSTFNITSGSIQV